MTTIPTAVRRLSNQVRGVAGESLVQIKESNAKLEQATTPSLRALQLYSQGMVFVNEERWGPAAELLEQAVQADPDFASAQYTWPIAIPMWARTNRQIAHFKRAFELADTATDRERYFILGSYYDSVGQAEKVDTVLRSAGAVVSRPLLGREQSAVCVRGAGRYGEAVAERTNRLSYIPTTIWLTFEPGGP